MGPSKLSSVRQYVDPLVKAPGCCDYVRMVMTATARRLAWGAFIAVALGYVIGAATSIPAHTFDGFTLLTASFPLVGIMILRQQPGNTIGWILLAIGGVGAADAVLASYGGYGLRMHPWLPGADVAAALSAPLWAPLIGIPGTYLLLLFPDGRLPSPRWRAVAWLAAIGIGGAWLGLQVSPGSLADVGFPNVMNPLGVEALPGVIGLAYVFISRSPSWRRRSAWSSGSAVRKGSSGSSSSG